MSASQRRPRSKLDLEALAAGDLAEPQRVLGPQRDSGGSLIRIHHPDAIAAECLLPGGEAIAAEATEHPGVFCAPLAHGQHEPGRYRVRFHFADGSSHEQDDPYRFPVTLGDVDLYLFAEGTHRGLWHVLGAHPCRLEGVDGVRFAVWAPRARRVSVVGEFCHWNGLRYPMRRCRGSGVFELFVPGVEPGALYKFEIKTADGSLRPKTDPFAFSMEHPPETASIVYSSRHTWSDDAWLADRSRRDWLREPVSIYEVHLGSWRPEHGSYTALAKPLIEHCRRHGFTHLELLPITEYPFDGSWGYQVSGYFAPTARHGDPDDFRAFVDLCHQEGIGVILDWVPAHFPRDDFALRRFDGDALYEYADPRMGEHPDWGTLVFDFGRNEVRNFLLASALYWLETFHLDGLRVDAVASMLYRDYSRAAGEWIPNVHGGRENLEAVSFLRQLNQAVHEEYPSCMMIAEESTAWPGVTRPASEGGLGFTFKWNLGWMNDTLSFLSRDPVHRQYHLDELTFAAVYEDSEHFIMPLSHDEVVHGKGSLLSKMPGDHWQKLAGLRALLGYQYTRPGKKLLFMGSELAPWREWQHDASLEWELEDEPGHAGVGQWLRALGELYRTEACLWRGDPDPEDFAWIDCSDEKNSVVSYRRRWADQELVVLLNWTPTPHDRYRIGAPRPGRWHLRLCSDATVFGGSGYATPDEYESEPVACHGYAQSLPLVVPPMSCLVLAPPGQR